MICNHAHNLMDHYAQGSDTVSALQFSCTIFKTQKRMDDYSASDMHYGDLSAAQLKSHYYLVDVSTRVNPYTLMEITPFSQPQSMLYGSRGEGKKIIRQECVGILFDEFRHLSQPFATYGPYRHLIEKMISHMQHGNGISFRDASLVRALKEQILNDRSRENSTCLRLDKVFKSHIDWENKFYPIIRKDELRNAISRGKLPKFDRFQDDFNGMGITVHDTWATHVTIKSLQIYKDHYRAIVHYNIQDHFGLDIDDISNFKFSYFRFFRIWFVLQRYNQFGFKPFMANMESNIEISGGRYEK